MATYTYPSNDLERGRALLRSLGSFWSSMYGGSSQVEGYIKGRALLEQQTHLNLIEAAASVGRNTVPTFHKENWLLLHAKESELSTATGALLAYDASASHGAPQAGGFPYAYGEARHGKFAINVPADLREVPAIFNRITDPSLCWVDGVDYQFLPDKAAIVFNENPFDSELVESNFIWEDGEVTDKEIFLWAFKAGQEHNHLHDHFAYVLGAQIKSGEPSRNLINAIFDAFVGGTATTQVEAALSAISGIPLAQGVETVEVVTTDVSSLLIVTDKNSYKFPADLTAAVAVGDITEAGQSLVTAFKIYEFNRGQLSSDLVSLTFSDDFLAAGFYGDLQFNNEDVPLIVEEGSPPISLDRIAMQSDLADFAAEGFTQYINVFGIPVLGTAGVGYTDFNHVANVLAEYLDNDKDGEVDNRLVGDALLENLAVMLVVKDYDELDALDSSAWDAAGFNTVTLVALEILPDDNAPTTFDGTLEKTLKLITSLGYAVAHPDEFDPAGDSALVASMTFGTDGGLDPEGIYTEYSAAAWYHNYDDTCDDVCQATDYLYWALTSILGAQEAHCEAIRDIWELCTIAEVEAADPLLYGLLTDPFYAFPRYIPTGNYVSHTKVSFEIDGFPLDIDSFFEEVHLRGAALNQTLAHLLDTRTNKVGEPKSSNLPATINPLKFLAENVLRNNVFVVRIAAAAFGPTAAGLGHLGLLRKIIPPHTAMITLLELQGFKDFVTIEEVDRLDTFVGTTPMSDTLIAPDDTDRVRVRLVTGTCQ